MNRILSILIYVTLVSCEGTETVIDDEEYIVDSKMYYQSKKSDKNENKLELPLNIELPNNIDLAINEKANNERAKRHEKYIYNIYKNSQIKPGNQKKIAYSHIQSTLPHEYKRMITADMHIQIAIEDAIHSEHPGTITAVVIKSLMDKSGTYILLPAYTKLICHYTGMDDISRSRLPVHCDRIIRPDGVNIFFIDANVMDCVGRKGVVGKIESNELKKISTTFLIGGIAMLASNYLQSGQSYIGYNQTVNREFNNLAKDYLSRRLDIQPIIQIKPGQRLFIRPKTDIYMVEK